VKIPNKSLQKTQSERRVRGNSAKVPIKNILSVSSSPLLFQSPIIIIIVVYNHSGAQFFSLPLLLLLLTKKRANKYSTFRAAAF
jgi:hypothetical protein